VCKKEKERKRERERERGEGKASAQRRGSVGLTGLPGHLIIVIVPKKLSRSQRELNVFCKCNKTVVMDIDRSAVIDVIG
jgi:hypothetical protein